MTRLSSDWTLFYKIFFPNVWIVFFGAAIGIIVFSVILPLWLLIGIIALYLGVVVFLWFTLMTFMRVEGTGEHLFVTNYFKTYRYTLESVRKITSFDALLFKVIVLHFHEKTSFGQRIAFIRRRDVWDEYLRTHPELADTHTRK
jgi:hypothetical protein